MQAASPEEREKLQKEMTDLLAKAGITGQRGQGRGGDGQAGGQGRGGSGGFGGQGRGGAGGGGWIRMAAMMRRGVNVGGFTEEDRKNAKLPLPPEQDSQVQVLLRPGLLADVEIQVEKLPDVIHVPAQAVFQKNGQYLVYVQQERQVRAAAGETGEAERIDDGDCERRAGGRGCRHGRSQPPTRRRRTARRKSAARRRDGRHGRGEIDHGTFQYRS